MMAFFQDAIQTMYRWGFLDVILPFILIFTIVFASLEKSKLLAKKESDGKVSPANAKLAKKFNLIIGLVFAGVVVIPHVIGNSVNGTIFIGGLEFPDAVYIINNSLPSIAGLIIAFLLAILLLEMFGGRSAVGSSEFMKNWGGWLTFLAVALVVLIFMNAAGMLGGAGRFFSSLGLDRPGTMGAVIVIIVFAVIVRYVMTD